MPKADVFEALIEHAPDALVVVDEDGLVVLVNRQTETLFGYRREELEGRPVEVLLPAARRAGHPEHRRRYVTDARTRPMGQGLPLMALRKDGSEFPIDITLAPIDAPSGRLVAAAVRGASERTQAEQARAALASIVASSHDAIIGVMVDGTVTSWNPGAERLYGYLSGEAIGRNLMDLVVPVRHRAESLRMLATVATTGEPVVYEAIRSARDGRPITVSVSVSPILDSRGGLLGIALVHRDVTERRRAERERVALERHQTQRLESLGLLAGGVAHDFNNLLAAILNYAELVLAEDLPPGVRSDVSEIVGAADRASILVHQLLIFGHREVVRPEIIDLNDTVRGMEQLLRPAVGEHIDFKIVPSIDLDRIRIDPSGAEQVLMNLVMNARDAMPDGGSLLIQTKALDVRAGEDAGIGLADGRYVQLTVADSGIGMEPDVVDRAFEPFFTTKEQGKGTGLGLATVYGIVSGAGGNVRIYSEPGAGTAVRVYLPAVESAVAEPSPPASPMRVHGEGHTILVVEDNNVVLQPTLRVLAKHGFSTLAARNGQEALNVLATSGRTIDLVITDVVMPNMGGIDLVRNMSASFPELPVLFMSGYAQRELDPETVGRDVPLIEKPFMSAELLEQIASLLPRTRRTE